MQKRDIPRFFLIVLLPLAACGVVHAQKGLDLFQEALVKERAEGRPDEAILLYQRVLKEAGGDRALSAKALVQMADCYLKVNSPEAQRTYERVVREFADQPEAVTRARAQLTAISAAVNAASKVPEPVVRPVTIPATAVVSPDGDRIAFIDRTGLMVRNLTAGNERPLAPVSGGDRPCGQPAWSGDGRRVAYLLCVAAGQGAPAEKEVRVIDRDGSGGRVVFPRSGSNITALALSPDGQALAFAAGAQMSLISLRDGSVRTLPTPAAKGSVSGLGFSADGRFLAYSRGGAAGPQGPATPKQVFVISTAGDAERHLVPSTASDQFVTWTPAGGILYASDRSGTNDLWLVRTVDGRPDGFPIRVKRDVGGIVSQGLTNRGALYYSTSTRGTDVYTVDLDPVTGKVLSAPAQVNQAAGHADIPRWSPDGRNLAFKAGPAGQPWPTIGIVSMETGEERHLALSDPSGPRFDWYPDGKSFFEKGGYRVDAATGDTQPVQGASGFMVMPTLLPDGQSVLFNTGPALVVLLNMETGARRTVLDGGANNPQEFHSVRVSNDTRSVAFVLRNGKTGSADLMIASLIDGTSKRLTAYRDIDLETGDTLLTWSPDDKYVFFADSTSDENWSGTNRKRTELWRIPVTGGVGERLGLTVDVMRCPSLSPDGRHLAFSAATRLAGGFVLADFLPTADLTPQPAGRRR